MFTSNVSKKKKSDLIDFHEMSISETDDLMGFSQGLSGMI